MTKITILEGPDGAGKSTLAAELVRITGAKLMHFNRQNGLRKTVARMYVEAMMPALLGQQDVILDRCWLSEVPYAKAFWANDDRLGIEQIRMLERIAMRCETQVIRCDPGWDKVEESFQARRKEEMLKNTTQLRMVYDWYKKMSTALPCMLYDYTRDKLPRMYATRYHTADHTAGNLDAMTMVVGDRLPDLTDQDHYMQFPFAAFSGAGDSKWLTRQFEEAGIGEERLFWCNAEHLHEVKDMLWMGTKILALGGIATSACREAKLDVVELPHPTRWRIDYPGKPYPVEAI